MKKDFRGLSEKRQTQATAWNQINNKKYFVGLGGPNLETYTNFVKSRGFEKILSFENSAGIFHKQLQQFSKVKHVSLYFDNICNHLEDYPNAFYDLDFCCCITTIEACLKKIHKLPQFTLTLSIRPVGYEKTLEIFRSYGNSKIVELKYYDNYPMLTILKN